MKKVGIWLLILVTMLSCCITVDNLLIVQAENAEVMLEAETEPLPLDSAGSAEQNSVRVKEKPFELYKSNLSERSIFGDPTIDESAEVTSFPIELSNYVYTDYNVSWTYSASRPSMVTFFDYKKCLNVAYMGTDSLIIQRYNANMEYEDRISIKKSYSLFGNITCDEDGYYYVVWGENDTDNTNCVTISVMKYDYHGNLIKECAYNGYETWDNYWGTQNAFRSGNCSLTINNGVLAVNYARQMYSGHQSNHIVYVDCATMTKLDGETAYVSHSFDQRIISLSDGGYLAVNHGDAYPRSFEITKIDSSRDSVGSVENFHFREGSNRDYGYNETYAQLGGIAETKNAYIFCGSSERTLSLEPAPTNQSYCGHSESRDLFIQILKKDFNNYVGADKYLVAGDTRVTTGTKKSDVLTKLFLYGSEVDYGVLWLTDYEDAYYACNPKVVPISDTQIVIMWEKRNYSNHNVEGTYYAVLDDKGNVLVKPMRIEGIHLSGNIDPISRDGKIYWATSNDKGAYIHCLTPDKFSTDGIYLMSVDRNGFVAGLIASTVQGTDVEYRWTAYNKDKGETLVVSDWKANDEWLKWKPEQFGEYILTAEIRIKDNPSICASAQTEAVRYTPHIKGKCQMPYYGEGGGYLIGIETYENPNQSYQYEMLILDCTLLAEGKDAWVWTTGKYTVPEGNAGWCVWQPQYGYYWTLFRVYDADGNMIDQDCYGFVNAY